MARNASQAARPVLTLIVLMTFAAALVAQFATQGVALFLRSDEASSALIGMLYLAAAPYTLRFLWAPIVDRYPLGGAGRYGRWLIATQAASCLTVAALFMLSPAQTPGLIVAMVAIFMLALGTQQTAIGGLMAAGLRPALFARATSLQGAASATAGMFLGAAVLYLLADIGWWAVIAALLSISVAALFLSMWLSGRADVPRGSEPLPPFLSQFSIFRSFRARQLFVVAFLVDCAILIPYAAKAVLLIDAGFSVSDGALYGIVGGNLLGIVGALGIRPFVERFGGFRVLGGLGLLNIIVILAVLSFGWDQLGETGTVGIILFSNGAVFASFAASRAVALTLCRPGREATEMASFVGIAAVLYLLLAGGGMALLDRVGMASLSLAGVGLACLGVFLCFHWSSKAAEKPA
ncbi:MAG: hypothetical protein AAGK00_21015, partial [Pseudomonadota bacterium]